MLAGEWYRFELVVKPATGTCDFLVDGTAVVTGARLDQSAGAAAKLKVRSQSGGSSAQKSGVNDVLVRGC